MFDQEWSSRVSCVSYAVKLMSLEKWHRKVSLVTLRVWGNRNFSSVCGQPVKYGVVITDFTGAEEND